MSAKHRRGSDCQLPLLLRPKPPRDAQDGATPATLLVRRTQLHVPSKALHWLLGLAFGYEGKSIGSLGLTAAGGQPEESYLSTQPPFHHCWYRCFQKCALAVGWQHVGAEGLTSATRSLP